MSRFLKIWVAPPLIAAIYWLWSRTWRFQVFEHPEFQEARTKHPICFAHWHGDEMVVLRLGPHYRCAAMTSTSEDGELMTRILKLFGFGISRGSSTRGGARALLGLVKLIQKGYAGTVAVDGPKGPRHKVKPGIWHIAKHSGAVIVPTGVSAGKSFVFQKSWNKTFIPLPFSRVVVTFGSPIAAPMQVDESNISELETELERKLHEEHDCAVRSLMLNPSQKKLLALVLFFSFLALNCSHSEKAPSKVLAEKGGSILTTPARTPLSPVGGVFSRKRLPVIRHVSRSPLNKSLALKPNDKILRINDIPVKTVAEYQKLIKSAPTASVFLIERRGSQMTVPVTLASTKPRLPIIFEPMGVKLVREKSPNIAYMHQKDLTVYALASVDKEKNELQLNFIVDSLKRVSSADLSLAVYKKGDKNPLAKSKKILDELGSQSQLYRQTVPLPKDKIGPIALSLDIDKNKFHFEFQ